ncbi:hypothetical protein [Bartonella sp. MM73XJBT.G]|uniref:hypothetical protein n=1 Tax=Bartonella sp. MM73XJBT.G TaxID=3019097 RepID=UPI002360C4E6|nr:hypothetical protein [Bartonella sp. MM73XJBT.G]
MKFSVLLCLLILTACAPITHLNGIVDPNYKGRFQTKKMVIVGVGMSISEQKALEDTFEKSLVKYNVQILRGLELFPPTRNYSYNDKEKIITNKGKGADALLIVSVDNRAISQTYIPPTYHPGTSTSTISGFGSFATIETETTPGYVSGGYNIDKPGISVSVLLINNTKNKEAIWVANGTSNGNAFASFSDLIVNVAETTVEKLAKEGLIAPK